MVYGYINTLYSKQEFKEQTKLPTYLMDIILNYYNQEMIHCFQRDSHHDTKHFTIPLKDILHN